VSRKISKDRIRARRLKIKNHLKIRGEKYDFVVSEGLCRYWWHMLNVAVFDGMLTPPASFKVKRYRDSLGWCLPWKPTCETRRVTIGIHADMWDRREFLTVLVHEMVHQWEWEVVGKWDPWVEHGKQFFSWKHKIKTRANLPLDKTY
jgi:hypothetical protein